MNELEQNIIELLKTLVSNSPFDWIQVISSLITGFVSIFVIWQIFLIKKQMRDDHERSRRDKAIQLCSDWSKSLNQRSAITRKFILSLSEDQMKSIFAQESFYIQDKPEKIAKLLYACTKKSEKYFEKRKGRILIDERTASEIRWVLITYLNNLESIIAAWATNIADKEIIELQFSYLFSEGDSCLKSFRKIAGGTNSYPYLELFSLDQEKKKEKHITEKYKLG